jgi:hypothetical protein
MRNFRQTLEENIVKAHRDAARFEHSNVGRIARSLKKMRFFRRQMEEIKKGDENPKSNIEKVYINLKKIQSQNILENSAPQW